MLDEWDDAEGAELRQIRDFMVDFRLTDKGELEFQSFGEECQDEIWKRAYPILTKARDEGPKNAEGEPTAAAKGGIRKAVAAERKRVEAKSNPKLAETELGRTIQRQLGAPAAMIDRRLKAVAIEALMKVPTSGRKQ